MLMLLCPILWPGPQAQAQTVVLERDTRADTLIRPYGKNYRHYVYPTLSTGLVAGPSSQGLPIKFGGSIYLGIGVIYKLKLSGFWALGAGVDFNGVRYRIQADSTKTFPNATPHDKERYALSTLSFSAFVRYNLDGRRGNNIGKFLDLGATLGVFTQIEYETFDRDPLTSETIQTIRTDLPYTNDFSFSLFARAGLYNLMFYVGARLTPVFNQGAVRVDLPALQLGLTVGIH